jgi:CBS domain-containing protein
VAAGVGLCGDAAVVEVDSPSGAFAREALSLLNGATALKSPNFDSRAPLVRLLRRCAMRVGSICTRRVVTIDSRGTLAEAARLMREHHVGSLVITSDPPEGSRVVGIVTDRDLVVGVVASGLDTNIVTIGDLARPRIATVAEDDDISTAIEAMKASGVRRLVVTNAERHLSGIVSLDDLLLACARDMAGLAGVIRSGAEREAGESAAPAPAPRTLHVPAMGTAGWGPERGIG